MSVSKHFVCNGMGMMDSIMMLRGHWSFKYVHGSMLLGQFKDKMFVFTMPMKLLGSVWRSKVTWRMFDHIKRLQGLIRPWHAMCTLASIVSYWWLQVVRCNSKMVLHKLFSEKIWILSWAIMKGQMYTSRVSWQMLLKLIGMWAGISMRKVTQACQWLVVSKLVFSLVINLNKMT